ncbi:alginate lyase family protein [Lachnospiraceae bacterium 38-14]
MKELAESIFKRFPGEAQHAICTAAQAVKRYFTFTNKWDLEQSPYALGFEGEIAWEENPGNDPEFVWQFNRHRFFMCLGQAYQMTGEERYAACLAELLTDWIKRVPLTAEHENKAWRSLEAGFRGEYWTKAVSYIKDSPAFTHEVRRLYESSLLTHAGYLEKKHSQYKYISNWGVIENHGLFEIGAEIRKFDREKGEYYCNLALEHLDQAVKIQFMRDGVHWEQSPMYHCEVVRCLLDVMILAKREGIFVPGGIKEGVEKALYAMAAWKKPDGHMFMGGDSDDLDMAECFVLGAYYFKDGVLKFAAGGEMEYEAAFFLGLEGIRTYEGLERKEPGFLSKALADSGHFYLRSGWDEKANLLHFSCGTLGAGHGHSDKLHVDLVLGGRDILVDAGRYTYTMEGGRARFKDPTAHNTSILDGEFFTVCKDSWECSKLSQPGNTAFYFTDQYEYVQGGHLGYMDKGVFFNRRIIHIKPDIYVIADEMYGAGRHCYETFFHFSEKGKINLQGSTAKYRDSQGEADIFFLSEKLSRGTARIENVKSEISRHYNNKSGNSCLSVRQEGEGFTSIFTVLSPGSVESCEKIPVSSALKGITYEPKQAEALRLLTKQGEYILILCHEEVNSPTDLVCAGGCTGFPLCGLLLIPSTERAGLLPTLRQNLSLYS